jgi:1-phosphatidylinositol-4-phosphate 5-kinase
MNDFNCIVCDQFCENGTNHYENIIDHISVGTGLLSLAGGLLVFVTYGCIPRLRKKRSTKRAILIRTSLDVIAALVSILSSVIPNVKTPCDCDCFSGGFNSTAGLCDAFGVFNTFLFLASLTWYLVLSLELYFAIKSPFSVDNKYRVLSYATGWTYPVLFTGVIIILAIVHRNPMDTGAGPGLSLFHICWISVNTQIEYYIVLHILGYLLPLLVAGFIAIAILFRVYRLLRTQMPATSEIRREVLKQNGLFVSFLTLESIVFFILWISQIIYSASLNSGLDRKCFYFGDAGSAVIAGLFAVIYGLKGILDFVLWWFSNAIKWKEIRAMFCCRCGRNRLYIVNSSQRTAPLIDSGKIEVDKTLRRDVMFCINLGILSVIDSQISKKEEERNRFSKSADDTLADFVDEYISAREFEAMETVVFAQGNDEVKMELRPPDLSQTVKFVNVEPDVFARLRICYRTDLSSFRASFQLNSIKDIEDSGMLEKFTEGKSGSFFYFTRDWRYIIKTVTDEELAMMKRIAQPYYHYLKDNPDTLLPRFFGLYRVRMASEQSYISVVVMENILFSQAGLGMNVKYDLKGSTHGRRTLKKDAVRSRYKGTLKDLDLDRKVALGKDNRERLVEQLDKDAAFLSSHAIMDYSLLLGIHTHKGQRIDQSSRHLYATAPREETGFTIVGSPVANTEEEEEDPFHVPWYRVDYGGLRSTDTNHPAYGHTINAADQSVEMLELSSMGSVPETYFIGIIDILQEYNWKKKTEHFLKTRVLCANPHAISAVNQQEYAERFKLFMKDIVFE